MSSPAHNIAPPRQHRTLILGLVVILWLSGTAILLWWFQSRSIQPFVSADSNPATLQARSIENTLQPYWLQHQKTDAITLIHFWNPDCLCNQVSARHFESLVAAFGPEQLEILVIAPASTTPDQLEEFQRLNGSRMKLLTMQESDVWLPASPSLALMNPDGKLGYFGAYGFGATCSISDEDFFPNIVREMRKGSYGPFLNMAGSGCFCRWPQTPPQATQSRQ